MKCRPAVSWRMKFLRDMIHEDYDYGLGNSTDWVPISTPLSD